MKRNIPLSFKRPVAKRFNTGILRFFNCMWGIMKLQQDGKTGVFDSLTEFKSYSLGRVNIFFTDHPDGILLLNFRTREGWFRLQLQSAEVANHTGPLEPVTWNDLIRIHKGALPVGVYQLFKLGKKGRDVVVSFSKIQMGWDCEKKTLKKSCPVWAVERLALSRPLHFNFALLNLSLSGIFL